MGSLSLCEWRLPGPPEHTDAMCIVVRTDHRQAVEIVQFLANIHTWYKSRRHVEVAFAVTDVLPEDQAQTATFLDQSIRGIESLYTTDARAPHFSVSEHRFDDEFTTAYRHDAYANRLKFDGTPYSELPCCRTDAGCKAAFAVADQECHGAMAPVRVLMLLILMDKHLCSYWYPLAWSAQS